MTSRFSSEVVVRPDDIDQFQHVHNSEYFDYVQAARYEQMTRYYKMSMEEFLLMGHGWVIRKSTINFRRPLIMGDTVVVTTQVKEIEGTDCIVEFEMVNKQSGKTCSDGEMIYTMINLKTGRAEKVTDAVKEKYLI